MTRTVVRSLFVVSAAGAFAAAITGCTPQTNVSPPTTGAAGFGPVVVTGAAGTSGLCGGFASGSGTGGFAGKMPPGFANPLTPQVGATRTAAVPPPAISGGTLRILKDGTTAVASDPDRDKVYVVDLTKRVVTATIALQPGDEPGRVAADADGRVHVALRRGGALVTIDPKAGTILSRRNVCAAPRGVAYDAATKLVHVACSDGQLVSLPAAGGDATRTLQLDQDLRDVIVAGNELKVTRFKSAELLTVNTEGKMMNRVAPSAFRSTMVRGGQIYTPGVAWRAVEMPSGGVAILHQRGVEDTVEPAVGGYSGFSQCDSIVQTAVTTIAPGQEPKTGPAISGMVLAVDMAVSADGNKVAMISAGNATNSESEGGTPRMPRVFVTDMDSATDQVVGCMNDGQHAPCIPQGMGGFFPQGGTGAAGAVGADGVPIGVDGGASSDPANTATPSPFPSTCGTIDGAQPTDPSIPQVVGEPIAVAYAGDGRVVVQSREPALLELPGGAPITLSTESHADTGHALFHANAGGMIACASCHPEGNEDGRIWTFACEGTRRTQSLQVGLKGTEPFHWGGDQRDFTALVQDVFVGRMSGPELQQGQVEATLHWIDAQPRRTKTIPTDTASIERGRALFNDTKKAACVTCHTGASFTNNQTVDVGTGGPLQVPSLVNISTRAPFMHNGCAQTLKDRFGPCGGGDKHGVTSGLSTGDINDLVNYLQTL